MNDFASAFTRTDEDDISVDTRAQGDESVGGKAGDAARKVKDRAEEAWETAFEAAQATGSHGQGSRTTRGQSSNTDRCDWLKTLELQPGASQDDVRKAYRRLMRQYHPDRYASDPTKYEAATEVARKLTDAYNGLREGQ